MTSHLATVEHQTRRLIVTLPRDYEDAREHYEAIVPEVDHRRFADARTWEETLEVAASNAPHGFMRYHRGDIAATLAKSPSSWNATQYLMGNHTIAERMFRHDPSVMLHAPLRTLLYVDAGGDTRFAVDQPSLLFGSCENDEIAAVGEYLDALLAQLIAALGAEVPQQLKSPAGHSRDGVNDVP